MKYKNNTATYFHFLYIDPQLVKMAITWLRDQLSSLVSVFSTVSRMQSSSAYLNEGHCFKTSQPETLKSQLEKPASVYFVESISI